MTSRTSLSPLLNHSVFLRLHSQMVRKHILSESYSSIIVPLCNITQLTPSLKTVVWTEHVLRDLSFPARSQRQTDQGPLTEFNLHLPDKAVLDIMQVVSFLPKCISKIKSCKIAYSSHSGMFIVDWCCQALQRDVL